MRRRYFPVFVLVLVALMFAVSSDAAISVTFSSGAGSITDHTSAFLPVGQVFLVYWSPDASLDGFNIADPLNPLGGDCVLTSDSGDWWFDTSDGPDIAGRITGNLSVGFGAGTSAYSGGYLYIAVFEIDYASYSGEAFAHETYFGLGPISESLTSQYPAPNTVDNYGALITASPIVTDQQVNVPEPTTMALMAVGALALAGMRRRKSPDIV